MPLNADYVADDIASFVPEGASHIWPFRIGPEGHTIPPWNARLLLWWGLIRALLRIQPTETRDHWSKMPREQLHALMRKEGAGVEHPSRTHAASLVQHGESVLDIGCGTGVGFESLRLQRRAIRYVGIDSSEAAIEIARELYAEADFRKGDATRLLDQFAPASFDVVLVRHVLEHLLDFEEAMIAAVTASRRLAIFVFYLTPRDLPFAVRKLDPGHGRSMFHAHIYSRAAIECCLTQHRLHWRWHNHVGLSRAGWFEHERNSILQVSRLPIQ